MLPASAISRVTGVNVEFRNFNSGTGGYLPQRLAVIGVGNDDAVYTTQKHEATGSADAIAKRYGYGSPLHLAARQFYPDGGGGANFPVTFYPLAKANSSLPAAGVISCDGTAGENGSGTVSIAGIDVEFAIQKGQGPAAILAAVKERIAGKLEIPVVAGAVDVEDDELPVTAKWSGDSGNDISISITTDVLGITFDVTTMAGGAVDPEVGPALAAIGQIWETVILNTFSYNKITRLDTYQSFGDGRWSEFEKKPLLVAHGCADDYETRTAVTGPRKTDRVNFLIESTASPELPCVIAARGLVNVMNTANSNPPHNNYGTLGGIKAGPDEAQENYTTRNNAVAKGASTNLKNGSVAELNDIITFWHPDNEINPAYRYVVDIFKLQNIVFNVRMILESDEVKGAPLVPDSAATRNPKAIQPKTIKTSMMNLANSLEDFAILADAVFTKERLVVKISNQNPKRLDLQFPCKVSGNVEVSSADIYFGFYLGE
jgi:phage tail sheath gpL-like